MGTENVAKEHASGRLAGRAALEERATRSSSSDSDFCQLDPDTCYKGAIYVGA